MNWTLLVHVNTRQYYKKSSKVIETVYSILISSIE